MRGDASDEQKRRAMCLQRCPHTTVTMWIPKIDMDFEPHFYNPATAMWLPKKKTLIRILGQRLPDDCSAVVHEALGYWTWDYWYGKCLHIAWFCLSSFGICPGRFRQALTTYDRASRKRLLDDALFRQFINLTRKSHFWGLNASEARVRSIWITLQNHLVHGAACEMLLAAFMVYVHESKPQRFQPFRTKALRYTPYSK